MARTRKQRRLQHTVAATEDSESGESPKCDLISTLPWELIAEILGMTSPKEVLALARCSSHFCNSLVANSRSKRIWEAARKSSNPPLPDPTPNFTESAYAAFVFDGGPCEECGKYIDDFYVSFSLRLRVCGKNRCLSEWKKKNAYYALVTDDVAVTRWLLSSEESGFYRKSEILQALKELRKFLAPYGGLGIGRQRYNELHEIDQKKQKPIMDLSRELLAWKSMRSVIEASVKEENHDRLLRIAEREGWELDDMLNSPTCAALYRHFNRSLECFAEQDFNVIKADVEAEVAASMEKKARSIEETAYAERRRLVALDYHRKKSIGCAGPNPVVLPTLSVFREQPVIKAMQNKQGSKPEDMGKKLEEPSVKGMVDDNLSAWRDQTRNAFMKILGERKYSTISTKKLHPVDRLVARFLCTRCVQHYKDVAKVPPLDFREACGHQCSYLSKKQKAKVKWSPDQFQLDHKAIKVTRKLLARLQVSEDDKESLKVKDECHNRILCRSCDGKINMNFEAMLCHSHRHEDMEIEILSSAQAKQLKIKRIHWGLCAELESRAKSAPRKAELKEYGCRHCLQYDVAVNDSAVVRMETADGEMPSTKPKKAVKPQKLMSFHGMRCHLLQSHKISFVLDEDIYRDDESAVPANP